MEEVEEEPEGLEEEEDAGHSPLLPPAPSNCQLTRLEEEEVEEGVETASAGVVDVVVVMEDMVDTVLEVLEDTVEDTVEDVVEDVVEESVVTGAVV